MRKRAGSRRAGGSVALALVGVAYRDEPCAQGAWLLFWSASMTGPPSCGDAAAAESRDLSVVATDDERGGALQSAPSAPAISGSR